MTPPSLQHPPGAPRPVGTSRAVLRAVDLFAGAGGATRGLRDAGFDVVAAVENDPNAAQTWRMNHDGLLFERDIRDVDAFDVADVLETPGSLDLLKSCAPCQGFSSLRGGRNVDSGRNDLVLDTLRFVDGLSPRAVLLENVPGLRRDARFPTLTAALRERGYTVRDYTVDASKLGVPQRRRRLVVLAVRECSGELPLDTQELVTAAGMCRKATAGEALSGLHAVLPADDAWHRWRASSQPVAARIAAIPVGGTRFDLPSQHRLDCHQRLTHQNGTDRRVATASYGRVRADEPAPTMTTRCTTPACGSFIHPTENRGLSLREVACFQTFPADYHWFGGYDSVERQIGNAVPVRMAEALGRIVADVLRATTASRARA